MAKIKRPDFSPIDGGQGITSLLRQFLMVKREKGLLEKREKEVKDWLSGLVEEYGEEDDRGHIYYDLPDPVEGVVSLKREKRQTRSLDQNQAEAILRSKGLYEDCTKRIVVLDEDAIMQAYYSDRLSEEDIDAMFTTKVNYAFVPMKERR